MILPSKPYTPRRKGKVERQVGYVEGNGLKGKSFASLQEQNAYLLEWETRVADTNNDRRSIGAVVGLARSPCLVI